MCGKATFNTIHNTVFEREKIKRGRLVSSGMSRRVALVKTDVSEELCASFIRMTKIGKLVTMLVTASVVPSSPILVTLMKEALGSSETSVLTRTTRRNIPEDTILHLNYISLTLGLWFGVITIKC
jgi:hypothetical protein